MSEKGGGDRKRQNDGGRGGGGGGGGKKSKYYPKSPGSGSAIPQTLPYGGILITCETHFEQRAAREALLIIEEHYDKLKAATGSDKPTGSGNVAAAGEAATGTKDISALLAEEVAGLKDKTQHRFKIHFVDVKGCTFIIFPEEPESPSPLEVVLSILREAQATKVLRARNCHRLLPITHACYSSLEAIKEHAPKVLEGHFPTDEGTEGIPFAVEYEHRSADKFDRMTVINSFADLIKSPPHKVELTAPAKTILVELTRNAVGLAVVTHYKELARFNIRKLTEVVDEAKAKEDADKKVEVAAAKAVKAKVAEGAAAAAAAAEGKAEVEDSKEDTEATK